ncbi:hypothetical protein WSM22_04560 [Cytophagales bacterium WSM2-2]|nr:hypothetical protein WSM22_04560 [Cytophagales bacterium WSM2-2]
MDNNPNPNRGYKNWNVLLVLTFVLAIVVTVLVVSRPSHYMSADKQGHKPEAAKEPAHQEPAKEEPKTEQKEEAKKTEPQSKVERKVDIASSPNGKYTLVAGSFLSEERAKKFQDLIKTGFNEATPAVLPVKLNDTIYYRVIVSRMDDMQRITLLKEQLTGAGYGGCWIYER